MIAKIKSGARVNAQTAHGCPEKVYGDSTKLFKSLGYYRQGVYKVTAVEGYNPWSAEYLLVSDSDLFVVDWEFDKKEDSMPTKTFYLVLIDASDLPRKRYDNFDDATNAAERLLSLPENKGKSAYILKAISRSDAELQIKWITI